jgi:hypothetical protein
MHRLQIWFISDLAMPMSHEFIDDSLAGDSGNRRLAGRIHIRYHNPVGIVEGAAKFPAERFRSRKTVRLKHCDETPPSDRFRCAERGANFCRMMPIIVDEQKPVARVFDLEPSTRVLKFPKRSRDFIERN